MTHAYLYHLTAEAYERQINHLFNRMLRIGLCPAWMHPRIERDAEKTWNHNEQRHKAAKARRQREAHHDQTTLQAKAWKAKYDNDRRLRRETTVNAQPQPL